MSAAVTRTKLKWFWAWDAPKEEAWLEQMASEGWHLSGGCILYTFVKGAPSQVRYRIDYRTETRSNLQDYISLCKDAGWDHVSRFAGWHYFLTSDPAAPELHTDSSSLADRYKRLLVFVLFVFVLNAFLLIGTPGRPPIGRFADIYTAMTVIRIAILALLGYAIFRIVVVIRKLKGNSGRTVV